MSSDGLPSVREIPLIGVAPSVIVATSPSSAG
jgi:hypothetical protein